MVKVMNKYCRLCIPITLTIFAHGCPIALSMRLVGKKLVVENASDTGMGEGCRVVFLRVEEADVEAGATDFPFSTRISLPAGSLDSVVNMYTMDDEDTVRFMKAAGIYEEPWVIDPRDNVYRLYAGSP